MVVGCCIDGLTILRRSPASSQFKIKVVHVGEKGFAAATAILAEGGTIEDIPVGSARSEPSVVEIAGRFQPSNSLEASSPPSRPPIFNRLAPSSPFFGR
jgi:hypothetical protein